jgi:hypothetical protein
MRFGFRPGLGSAQEAGEQGDGPRPQTGPCHYFFFCLLCLCSSRFTLVCACVSVSILVSAQHRRRASKAMVLGPRPGLSPQNFCYYFLTADQAATDRVRLDRAQRWQNFCYYFLTADQPIIVATVMLGIRRLSAWTVPMVGRNAAQQPHPIHSSNRFKK